MKIMKACKNCMFFHVGHIKEIRSSRQGVHMDSEIKQLEIEIPYFECRRFPQVVGKQPDDWCGEHKPVDE